MLEVLVQDEVLGVLNNRHLTIIKGLSKSEETRVVEETVKLLYKGYASGYVTRSNTYAVQEV